MAEYSLSRTFGVGADRLWTVASDARSMSQWLPTAQRSAAQAGDRVQLAGESHGHRYDTAAALQIDAAQRRLSWSAPDEPSYHGWLQVTGDGNSGSVSIHLTVSDERPATAQGDEVERGMAETLDRLAEVAAR